MGFDTIEINLIGSKNELGQAKVLSQKTFPKNFRSKKIVGQKYYRAKKFVNFCLKNILSKKLLDPQFFWTQNNF